jgi:hypothetical protein
MGRKRNDRPVDADRLGWDCVECGERLTEFGLTLCAAYPCTQHVCQKCWDAHIDLHRLAGAEISESYEQQVRQCKPRTRFLKMSDLGMKTVWIK